VKSQQPAIGRGANSLEMERLEYIPSLWRGFFIEKYCTNIFQGGI